MLETIRRWSKGWIMKIILGLLALTFVVFFGASDFGGGHGGGQSARNTNAVLEVDNVDISLHQIGREYNQQLQQIARASGQQIPPDSPIMSAVLEQSIQTMVTRALYDVASRELGVSASDLAVQDAVRRIPAFAGPSGNFDGALFRNYLLQAGLSEQQFVAGVREDLQRSQYLATLGAGITVPDPMLDAIYKYRFEQRVVELVTVSAATVEGLSQPDEAQLSTFYEQNRQAFQAPEYRSATVAQLTLEEFAQTLDISDEEVADTYADRLDLFQQPERREILQAIFFSEEDAKRAADQLAQGRPFTEAVEAVAGFPPVSMGQVERNVIDDATLAEQAFSIDAGGATEPVETALGWQILSVATITPEETQPLSEVADDLRRAISLQQARDDIFDVLNDFEDGLAAGSPLEEIARETGVTIQRLEPFNAGGLMRNGERIEIDPLAPVVTAVFSGEQGEVGDVIDREDGGFFAVRVDDVTPPQIEPLDTVRDRVTAAWLDNERFRLALERATELADRARGGSNLEELANEAGATFETTGPFDRTGQGSTIAGQLIGPIFAANEGDIVQSQVQDGAGVARLVEIRRVGTGGNDLDRDDLREQLSDGINRDVAQQLSVALRDRYSIDIDRDTIEQSLLP